LGCRCAAQDATDNRPRPTWPSRCGRQPYKQGRDRSRVPDSSAKRSRPSQRLPHPGKVSAALLQTCHSRQTTSLSLFRCGRPSNTSRQKPLLWPFGGATRGMMPVRTPTPAGPPGTSPRLIGSAVRQPSGVRAVSAPSWRRPKSSQLLVTKMRTIALDRNRWLSKGQNTARSHRTVPGHARPNDGCGRRLLLRAARWSAAGIAVGRCLACADVARGPVPALVRDQTTSRLGSVATEPSISWQHDRAGRRRSSNRRPGFCCGRCGHPVVPNARTTTIGRAGPVRRPSGSAAVNSQPQTVGPARPRLRSPWRDNASLAAGHASATAVTVFHHLQRVQVSVSAEQ